jgi:hypothetical protein
MKRIIQEIGCSWRRLATALTVLVIGVAFTLVGTAVASPDEKEVKEVKAEKVEKIEKIEKIEKELKELKADSRALINRRVLINRNEDNKIRFIRPLDLEELLGEELD